MIIAGVSGLTLRCFQWQINPRHKVEMQKVTVSLALLLKRLAEMLLFFSAPPSAKQKLWAAVHTVHRAEMFEVKHDGKELAVWVCWTLKMATVSTRQVKLMLMLKLAVVKAPCSTFLAILSPQPLNIKWDGTKLNMIVKRALQHDLAEFKGQVFQELQSQNASIAEEQALDSWFGLNVPWEERNIGDGGAGEHGEAETNTRDEIWKAAEEKSSRLEGRSSLQPKNSIKLRMSPLSSQGWKKLGIIILAI